MGTIINTNDKPVTQPATPVQPIPQPTITPKPSSSDNAIQTHGLDISEINKR